MRVWRGSAWVAATAGLMAVGIGLFALKSYTADPGDGGGLPARGPEELAGGSIQLFLHPHCPCSRASVAELASALTARPSAMVYVYFVVPPEAPQDWERSALWEDVARLPDVFILRDELGRFASHLGAKTSGHALVYDGRGRLRYSGGLTAGRGRAGEKDGRHNVLAALDGERVRPLHHPVFGCPLTGLPEPSASDSPTGPGGV